MIKTDFKGVAKALAKINRKISKIEDIATTRALNIILNQQQKEIAKDVSDEYEVTQGSARSRMKMTKATRHNKEVKITASSTFTNLVKPQMLAGRSGISVRKKGGGRGQIKVNIKPGASKPFVIKAKAGGESGGKDIKTKGGVKKVAVYVPKGFNEYSNIEQRKVKTLRGSTIARMISVLKIQSKDLAKAINKKFPKIYSQQLKKANFTGSK